MKWDGAWITEFKLTEDQIIQRVRRQFGTTEHLLIVASKPLADPRRDGYRLIYHDSGGFSDDNGRDESYYLYYCNALDAQQNAAPANRANTSAP
jgi:hypothetical protein